MVSGDRRINRERKTVEAMIHIYCRDQHGGTDALCSQCNGLVAYARQRLEKCPYGEGKTTCSNCPIHCYKADMRAEIRQVMRYAGPRMIFEHPGMALMHLVDGRRKEPIRLRDELRAKKKREA